VCPLNFKHDEFVTSAVDNIDYNPSSTTSVDSFHGTGILLFQHLDSSKMCRKRDLLDHFKSINSKSKSVPHFPDFYTIVYPVPIMNKEPLLPSSSSNHESILIAKIQSEYEEELKWLMYINRQSESSELVQMDTSWSSFHATRTRRLEFEITRGSLLPLFHDEAHSTAMIKHSFKLITAATMFLNPNQLPVVTMEQPLYAILDSRRNNE
jgi:hypothetical protein